MSPMRTLGTTTLLLALFACGPSPRGSGDDAGSGSCTGAQMCSADLHSVVDCNGNVVTTCGAEQGCSDGACVDACMAAAANSSSIGCDYYSVDPDIIEPGGCFAAYIANTWNSPVMINVDYNGSPLSIDAIARIPSGQGLTLTYAPLPGGALAPGQVAILFLASIPGEFIDCPAGITPGVTLTDAAVHGTALGTAFHITTSAPVVAYDISPFGGGTSAITSATLLLPTSAWDTNYVAVDAYSLGPTVDIVAQNAGTQVTIRPTVAIDGGTGVAAAAQNVATTYTLGAGQVLQFTQSAELGGSPITATGPIGVWGGSTCMDVPTEDEACDGAHQEIPPVKALGYRYMGVRYRGRYGVEESVPWRVVGGVDGTTLTYSPAAPAGAPTTLMQGQVVEFDSPGQFFVQSQDSDHPFYMAGYMTGCQAASNNFLTDCRGDPEFVNIMPPEQYLSAYTFFTDPTYPETNLVLTREKKNGSFADVTVDCAGTITGWTPIDSADTMEYARLDLVTGNFTGVGNCDNGLHTASSAQPFGLVVWGWGSAATGPAPNGDPNGTQAVSYAYPAGAGIKQINSVVIE